MPRHWSLVPLSIAAHVVVALAVVIIPLAADVELPAPYSHALQMNVMAARPLPPAPSAPRAQPPATGRAVAAPVVAASTISREEPAPSVAASDGIVTDTPGIADGVPGGGVGVTVAAAPPVAPPTARPAEPVRVGGLIREPQKVVHVPPVYPPLARSAGVQGIVILEAIIDERGVVDQVRVRRSSPLLDAAAVEAVRQWRYTPTLLNGSAVPVLMTITVHFTLQR